MAKVDGYGLDQGFAKKLSDLLDACAAKGYDFRLSQGLRTPQKQAEYYCKWAKRTPADVDKAADKMAKDGAPWLSALLRSYRDISRQADWLTNALPGGGWHQWGEAADCYCYRNGAMVKDGSDPCYKFYADTAISMGLTPGYYFTNQDSGHVQLRDKASAANVYTWAHIDEVMKERFGDKHEVALSAGATISGLLKASPLSFGPLIAAAHAGSKFFKDDPDLITARLTPDAAFVTSGASAMLRTLAETYNRIGGLLEVFGTRLSIDPVAALAVWYVESGGRSFMPGHPVLRFENHIFFDKWGQNNTADFDAHFKFGGRNGVAGKRWQHQEYRLDTTGPFRASHPGGQATEYEAFGLAKSLGGAESACLSASWGGSQIMGFNYDVCGYSSAAQMVAAFSADERWHVLGFADFCRDKDLIDDIQTQDWINFGQVYNGDGATYGPKIKAAFDLKSQLLALPRVSTGGAVMSTALPAPPFLFS